MLIIIINPVNYKIWGILQNKNMKDADNIRNSNVEELLRIMISWTSAQLIKQLYNGERDFERV